MSETACGQCIAHLERAKTLAAQVTDLTDELTAINKELDAHSILDGAFPTAMRVHGLVRRYADLAKLHEETREGK